jgi:hypothetical protein
LSEYYEIDKPFSRENWNKLIRDLNDMFENPPSGCEAVEAIEEVEEGHIWTRQDVEEVRGKMEEMCPQANWDWDGFDRLEKPWNKKIIDEIEEQMLWCECDTERINLAWATPELASINGDCGVSQPVQGALVSETIDGMQVGPSGYIGRFWRYTTVQMFGDFAPEEWWRENQTHIISQGIINCEGKVVYGSNSTNNRLPVAIYTYFSKLPQYDCEHPINVTRLDNAQAQVDAKIAGNYRNSADLEIHVHSAIPEEC